MSRSITALGQHTLPFHDRKRLIQEIAKRFEANVYYGFFEYYGLVKNELTTFKSRGIVNPEEGSISAELYLLDEVHISDTAPAFVLIEEDYIYKWLVEKFGEDAGYQKEFITHWSKDPSENNRIIQGFLEQSKTIDFYFNELYGLISLESADVGSQPYFTDWVNFFYSVTRSEYTFSSDFYQSLLEYRNKNRETILKLGGTCIYYHDDQGNNTGGAIQGDEWDKTWHEIETEFNSPEAKPYQINLCEALTNPIYLKHIQELTKDNFHSYSVFYDDFRELTWDDIIKP